MKTTSLGTVATPTFVRSVPILEQVLRPRWRISRRLNRGLPLAGKVVLKLVLFCIASLSICRVAKAEIVFTMHGNPSWKPVGGFISAVDFGDVAGSRPDEQNVEYLTEAFAPTYASIPSWDWVVPTVPQNTNDNETREIIARNGGFESDVFLASDLVRSNRLFRGLAIVPIDDSLTGNTQGGVEAPIIDPDILPLQSNWAHEWRDGVDVAWDWEFEYPNLDDLGEVVDSNNKTHDLSGLNWHRLPDVWTFLYTDNPGLRTVAGEYQSVIEYRDQENNGWDIQFFYSVVARDTDIAGDLNYDEEVDILDLNILTNNVALGGTHSRLDLDESGSVNVDDVHFWATNLKNTWVGDANLDGEFNSADFVEVFQAGKYEKDELALWSEGDWNADERFDSGDFVAAFQNGGYEMGMRGELAAVPEPKCMELIMVAICCLGHIRRHR